MSWRSLLVHLDSDARCDARIRLAARWSAAHAGHLVGIATTGPIEADTGLGAASRQLDELAALRDAALHRAAQRVEHFLSRCRAEGAGSAEGHVHEGERAAVVLHHAHCADLVVVGQADPAAATHREDARFVEEVLLGNARPTLVVPHGGRFDEIGRKVLVAWDDSHGCARAATDALPLLRDAGSVHLRVWQRAGASAAGPIRERMEAVRLWLLRQGVPAEVRIVEPDGPIGEAILHAALDLGVDAVVMGTYGHSRWTERLVGGATRTALARSPVPLLMSR